MQQALFGRATGKVRHGQVKEGDQTAQQVLQRYVLTEGHQLLLEVIAAALAHHADAVVVTQIASCITLPNRYAGDQCCLAFSGKTVEHAQVALGAVFEYGNGGFRPDDQVGRPGAEGHVAVQRELGVELGRVPLQVLFDVALHGRYAQRRAFHLGPGVAFKRHAHHPRCREQ